MDDPVPIRVMSCRHRCDEGIHRKCAIGIDVEALITEQVGPEKFGRHYMSPCHDDSHESCHKATCKNYSPLTAEERKAEDEEREKFVAQFMTRMQLLRPLISKIKARTRRFGMSTSDEDECPACGGTLSWSCNSYNQHVAMRCSTDGCVNFIE